MQDSNQHHPFVAWWAALKRLDAITLEGKDFILSDLGGKRFAVGAQEGIPLLCWLNDDDPALGSIRWTSAAIAYGLKGRDWIALSSTDIRVKGSASLNPVPVRLFIPVTAGRLLPWKDSSPQSLALGTMKAVGGAPVMAGTPPKKVPLKLLGN